MALNTAVFALAFLLASCDIALARSSSMSREMVRLQADMTVDDALHKLKGKLPSEIAIKVRRSTVQRAKFLQGRSHAMQGGAVDRKNQDEAREKLNEMVEETQETLDSEDIQCKEELRGKREILEQITVDIAAYRSQETRASGDHLRAKSTIDDLQMTQERMQDEKEETDTDCKAEIAYSENQIAIMKTDSETLGRIVDMIECPTKATLLQCSNDQDVHTTFAHKDLRAQMAQLKTDRAKKLLNGAFDAVYNTAGSFTAVSKAAFFQEGEQFLHLGGEDTTTTTTVGVTATTTTYDPARANYPVENPVYEAEPTGCSLATNPNCGKFVDKFMEIKGQVDSDIDEFEDHLEHRVEQCKETIENLDTQISSIATRLGKWQVALAEAADRQIEAREGGHTKTEQWHDSRKDLKESKAQCDETVGNLKSEMCALGKIRGEVYKLSEIAESIADCEVDDWIYGLCTEPCGGGVQNLTRAISVQPDKGAQCPPTELHMKCNTFACPVNCDMEDWSEWSTCSVECGGGVQERIRSIAHYERHGGTPCQSASDTKDCNMQACDKDCLLGQWTKISSVRCSKACGGGVKVSTRPVLEEAIGEGHCQEMCDDPQECPERFRLTTCNLEPCAPEEITLMCQSEVDVIILLDGSGSLGTTGWEATKTMGQTLVKAFGKEPRARVAVEVFSGPKTIISLLRCFYGRWWGVVADPETDCGLKWVTPITTSGHFSTDMTAAAEEIKALSWPSASTYTSGALSQALAELMYARAEAEKVVVVVTDGWPLSPWHTWHAAYKLKKVAKLIWVPVTANAPLMYLNHWATAPSSQNVVYVPDFEILDSPDIVTQIIADVCPEAI